ncbi:MAG: hypothetical protein PWR06_2352 [Thermoanaerobacteraceae bacterium]|jgi:hypothetical protein|nr:hypothetical protein [Thermoanaerobacteraceae bacterium]
MGKLDEARIAFKQIAESAANLWDEWENIIAEREPNDKQDEIILHQKHLRDYKSMWPEKLKTVFAWKDEPQAFIETVFEYAASNPAILLTLSRKIFGENLTPLSERYFSTNEKGIVNLFKGRN